jgi:tRNA nucleotidyltransferase/poly(A) polymerase
MSKEEIKKFIKEYDKNNFFDDFEKVTIFKMIDAILKAQEEKHKEEMGKFAEWIPDNYRTMGNSKQWLKIRFCMAFNPLTTTELIEMFKKQN